jgi:hypothetical protein
MASALLSGVGAQAAEVQVFLVQSDFIIAEFFCYSLGAGVCTPCRRKHSYSPVALDHKYLFFQVEWQETTQGTSNSDTVYFRTNTSYINSTNFVPGYAGSALLAGAGALTCDSSVVHGGPTVWQGNALLAGAGALTCNARRSLDGYVMNPVWSEKRQCMPALEGLPKPPWR